MDHLAFNYLPSRGLLALPITVCEGGGDGTFGSQLTFGGLAVFDVSLASGITERGRLPFVDPAQAVASGASCGVWWSDSTSLVKRSIFMDDFVLGLSATQLRAASLADLSTVIATLPLIDPS